MAFPNTIRRNQGAGVIGEISHDGPIHVQALPVKSTAAANNVVGRAFRNSAAQGQAASADLAAAGSTFAGILIGPKQYPSFGTAGQPFGATLTVPNGLVCDFLSMGEIWLGVESALQAADPKIGDDLHYQITTGIVVTVDADATPGVGFAKIPGGKVARFPSADAAARMFVARLIG